MKSYFEIDNFGVNDNLKVVTKHEHAWKILKNTTKLVDNAWETGLLWKDDNVPQIDSRSTALKRLFSVEKKLDRDPAYAVLYYREMQRFLDNGYAVKVSEEVLRPRTWYLPHFGVTNINKPGKLRLVFDAAAKTSGISLNDQLDPGPDLLQSLPGVLLRFRQYSIAYKADIKDMYLRVQVIEKDRGALRFLWRGADRKKYADTYEMTCLVFGANSSPSSALYVKDENARSFASEKPKASQSITRNFYMDDYLASSKTVEEASEIIQDVIKINNRANFNMHSWASNNGHVLENAFINTNENKEDKTTLCEQGDQRVLGLFWNTNLDTLSFNVQLDRLTSCLLTGTKKLTKREFLKIIMSVFDPLGLLGLFTLQSRILMQEIWRSGVGWDDEIRDEEQIGWLQWVNNLKNISSCSVPRCITPIHQEYSNTQLHAFCDASLKAYTAVVYARFEMYDKTVHLSLIMAKTGVAPLKPMNVPRLELQAALLGARFINTVSKELEIKINKRFLWTDSMTVMRWIQGEPRTRQIFVAHRLGEINEITLSSEWRWVPTKLNPADYATRWVKTTIQENNPWFVGPDFLLHPENKWPEPKQLSDNEKKHIDGMEIRKASTFIVTTNNITFSRAAEMSRLFNWQGLLVLARRVRKAADRFQKISNRDYEDKAFAEDFCIRTIQTESFNYEINQIRQNKPLNKKCKILNMRPFINSNGFLCAEGRVTKIDNVLFNNFPIILDGKHPCVKLLLKEYHRRFYHGSHETIVNEVRQKFYIIGLRNTLRSIVYNCLICKLQRGKPQNPWPHYLKVV